jgi:putative protease
VKNRFAVGDRVDVVHPNGNRDITVTRMLAEDGSAIAVAPGSGHVVCIEFDAALDLGLLARHPCGSVAGARLSVELTARCHSL